MKKPLFAALVAVLTVLPSTGMTQTSPPSEIDQVVKHAIESNPEVQSAWHVFRSAGRDVDEARGGYYPTVDLVGRAARESRNYGVEENFSDASGELTLTQSIFDGFFTRSEVERLSNAELVRYYELLDAAERTALEALVAYQDVRRQRDLVDLARDNYQQHLDVQAQVQESTEAGVARGADFQQIEARVAQAESNLINETSNLHDVSARYRRIVGLPPADQLDSDVLEDAVMAGDLEAALMRAYENNPSFRAALRDIESSRATIDRERSAYLPSLDLNASYGVDNRTDLGARDTRREARIGVELRVNLFNGGSDRAATESAVEQLSAAQSQRDIACRNIRQTMEIAYNDVGKLAEQMEVLNKYRLSGDRVRVAYRDQFQIGQRTLLDVLDSENEFFQAARSYVNAQVDHQIAIAEALTAGGQLLDAVDVRRDGLPGLSDLGAAPLPVDGQSACPGGNQMMVDR
ncbi:TolC family outer membrane protein [Spiribacter vilamensis]|uniref:Adhesin transport system outer membrane protein n=1 Tax=Spiribacter vilamensis TaxID=531306 RepID=A0A4Q8D0T0_9GAMM|nr:TolC family outer membrane protein [Spiribacter vilamensis]RZU98918.1 adhesin transport system outer membrane protein [Spiribacter vilamensis]TVO62072.1 TolC family outer membrane protein [Spiribacter vilamensis]